MMIKNKHPNPISAPKTCHGSLETRHHRNRDSSSGYEPSTVLPLSAASSSTHSPKKMANQQPHIFHIGPLPTSNHHQQTVQIPTLCEEYKTCINWLQQHPQNPVIYVTFGSWVPPIGQERISELALGLEASKRPFLWVLREDSAWRNGLPAGFLDRTAGRRKVVSWAPQEAVLAHQAVGCYMAHCGWNSMVEAIRYGKRMVCYPVCGDQFLNCRYIVRVWGGGIKPEGFGRREVEESDRGRRGRGDTREDFGIERDGDGEKGELSS